ncbi:unnamed protein product, partial [Mesorhabditis spiculigera]
MNASFGVLALLAILGMASAMFVPPFYHGPDNYHHDNHHQYDSRGFEHHGGHHGRFKRGYGYGGGMGGGYGGMGGGFGGGMGGMGGMGGGMSGMGGGQMGGQFPGIMQSNQNSWGSFSSSRQGGFNNQESALIMG